MWSPWQATSAAKVSQHAKKNSKRPLLRRTGGKDVGEHGREARHVLSHRLLDAQLVRRRGPAPQQEDHALVLQERGSRSRWRQEHELRDVRHLHRVVLLQRRHEPWLRDREPDPLHLQRAPVQEGDGPACGAEHVVQRGFRRALHGRAPVVVGHGVQLHAPVHCPPVRVASAAADAPEHRVYRQMIAK